MAFNRAASRRQQEVRPGSWLGCSRKYMCVAGIERFIRPDFYERRGKRNAIDPQQEKQNGTRKAKRGKHGKNKKRHPVGREPQDAFLLYVNPI
jgi:hypothetical protein